MAEKLTPLTAHQARALPPHEIPEEVQMRDKYLHEVVAELHALIVAMDAITSPGFSEPIPRISGWLTGMAEERIHALDVAIFGERDAVLRADPAD